MDLMQTFSSQGNEEMALSVGFALLKMDPKNYELMNKLGNSLRNTGSFAKAKKLYTYTLKINPQYPEAKYNLAACSFRITTADSLLVSQTRKVESYTQPRRYEFQGSRAGFLPVPNQSLEEEPVKKDGEGEGQEEELSEEALHQRLEGFIQQLKSDVEASGGSWESLFNLGLLYDLNKLGDLASQNYRQAAEKDPANRMSANNLGVALMEHTGDLKETEGVLLKNLENHPFDRTTVLNLALLYRKAGKQFQTFKYFVYLGDLLAKSLGEFETEAVEEHAKELFTRRKYLEAVPVFENLAHEKQAEFWLEKLVVMYLNQKKEDKYLSTYKRLLRLNPQHEEAQGKLTEYAANYESESRELLEKGNRHRAIEAMLKAVQIEETPERWVELAQLYQDDGEEILAENALRRWKKLTGADQEKKQASAS
jgi:tetratricopeptide (TPR) repeat protein